MKLPYFFVANSKIPIWLGHQATTFFVYIFLPGTTISWQALKHEYRHIQHFYFLWLMGIIFTLGVIFVNKFTFWWLLITPLTYTILYILAGFVSLITTKGSLRTKFYLNNWFERDARRYAGETLNTD